MRKSLLTIIILLTFSGCAALPLQGWEQGEKIEVLLPLWECRDLLYVKTTIKAQLAEPINTLRKGEGEIWVYAPNRSNRFQYIYILFQGREILKVICQKDA